MSWEEIRVGIDDTDSRKGMCTTYLGSVLANKFIRMGSVKFLDYPRLIRLNPSVPYKTRGNGAISFHLLVKDYSAVKRLVLDTVEDLSESREWGVFFCSSDRLINHEIARNAVSRVLEPSDALNQIEEMEGVEIAGGLGVIGAAASALYGLKDYTYELLSYRTEKMRNKRERLLDQSSVIEMDYKTYPDTFDNLDPETGRILICPRGKDPVLFGIRGEYPWTLLEAASMIKVYEEIERWTIYRTNQGTDDHISIREKYKPGDCIEIQGEVEERGRKIAGGHVIIRISGIPCAAYEPTGGFRDVILSLREGDIVRAYGCIRLDGKALNLEKIEILKLKREIIELNPPCPKCGRRGKSLGFRKGYVCKKCDVKFKGEKIRVEIPRKISEGKYEVPPRARRHISKPLIREGREKNGKLSKEEVSFLNRGLWIGVGPPPKLEQI